MVDLLLVKALIFFGIIIESIIDLLIKLRLAGRRFM